MKPVVEVWKIISESESNDTSVMRVPGGVVLRYRMHRTHAYASSTVSLVFIPGATLEDFKCSPQY